MTGRRPPQDVQEAAGRAVRWIEDGKAGAGFTDTGEHRAHQLAEGDEVSDEQLGAMRRYFARHVGDRDAEGWNRGDDGFPSPGRVAWDAWGGDPGRRWADTHAPDDD